jgi:hypothetical protein
MKKSLLLKSLLAVSFMSASPSAFGNAPKRGEVYFERISYNGSGCPQGSVYENLSPDNKAFTLTFAEYFAEVDGRKRMDRKFCQLTIDLKIPQGFQFAIGTFDYRGFVALDRGAMATHQTAYYFQGQGRTGGVNKRISGPIEDDFFFREKVGLSSLVWSPCGETRALNIKTSIMARSNGRAYGFIGNDSVDGSLAQEYSLMWRRCRR